VPTMERDSRYIAQTLRAIRTARGLTQQNVAHLANVTTRTIEKLESGRSVNEYTLRCIARGLGFDVSIFDKRLQDRQKAQLAEYERKHVLVRTNLIRDEQGFMSFFKNFHAFNCNPAMVEGAEAMQLACRLSDYLGELVDAWEIMSHGQRLMDATRIAELFSDIEAKGFLCYMGRYRMQWRQRGRPPLIVEVGLLAFLAKDSGAGERYAMVELEEPWETVEEDRTNLFTNPSNG
jgi:transcriptional regulator with XRE-family HTH domain